MDITWVTYLFSALGLYLFYRFAKYVRNELRIAPQKTGWQKFKVNFSTFLFAIILTSTILFIAAIVSTVIGRNAVFGLWNQGFITVQQFRELFQGFQFPILIPTILIGLGIYIVIYPFFETVFSFPQRRGAMEIHRWIEARFIDRFSPPWNYLAALLGFLGLYVVPPTVISIIITQNSLFNIATVIIFLDWFMIAPIFYLTYYAVIGSAQALFAGFKANLKKDWKRLVYLIFSILMIISVAVSLYSYSQIIFGNEQLKPSTQDEGISGFISYVVNWIMEQTGATDQQKLNWFVFQNIVPLDFLLFFITSMIFGLLGFYGKFLNKEPLNRPILVVFAAYIVCGIAFQIFANMMVKWPWVLPTQFVGLDFANALETGNENPLISFMWFFFPAVLADKILAAIFFIYQLGFNKKLRETINETILVQAIGDDDIKVLKKFTKDKKSRIRLMVAEALTDLIDTTQDPKKTEVFIPLIEELILDKDPEVVKAISPGIKLMGLNKSVKFDNLYMTIQLGFGTEKESTISEIKKIIYEIGRERPENLPDLYEFLYKGYLPDKVKVAIVDVLGPNLLGQVFPEISFNIAMPMLDKQNPKLKNGALLIIKTLINEFKPKFRQIYDKIKEIMPQNLIIESWNFDIAGNAFEIMSLITSIDETFVEEFLIDFKKFQLTDELKARKIGGLSQIIISYPQYLDRILPDIVEGLTYEKAEIKQDIIMALGAISLNLSQPDFLEKIQPKFEILSSEKDLENKKWIINTYNFLFKARSDLLFIDNVQNLIYSYLTDEFSEIREGTAAIINDFDFTVGCGLYLKAIRSVKDNLILGELMKNFNNMLTKDYIEKLSEFVELMDQIYEHMLEVEYIRRTSNESINQEIRTLAVKVITKLAGSSIELTEKSFDFMQIIIQGNVDEASSTVLDFISSIAFELHEKPNAYNLNLDLTLFYDDLKNLTLESGTKKILTRIVAVRHLAEVYKILPDKHMEIYQIFYDLRKDKDDRVKALIIKSLCQITCKFPSIYFKYEETIESRWLDQSKLEAEMLPILSRNFESKSELIAKSVSDALGILTKSFGETTLIKDFLFKIIKKKGKAKDVAKRSAVNCLTSIKNVETEYKVIEKLSTLTFNKDSQVRETALRGLADILLKMEPLKAYIETKDKVRIKSFKKLKYTIIRRKFQKDPAISVKKVFIEVVTEIAIKFPDLDEGMLIIKEFVPEDNEEISIQVIKSYFKFIEKHHHKLETSTPCMRTFANSSSTSVKSILLTELIEHYKSGEDLKYYIPTLLKLAVDKDVTIRKQSLDIFKEIYEKTTEKLFYFIQLLSKLTRDKNPRIRNESFNLIAQLTFQFPENVNQQNLVFEIFSKLAQDYNLIVKQSISKYLEDLIKVFPGRLNNTLRIIYSLLREKDRNILKNSTSSLRYALLLYPDRSKEIKNSINRFYRKSANPQLQALIQEFED